VSLQHVDAPPLHPPTPAVAAAPWKPNAVVAAGADVFRLTPIRRDTKVAASAPSAPSTDTAAAAPGSAPRELPSVLKLAFDDDTYATLLAKLQPAFCGVTAVAGAGVFHRTPMLLGQKKTVRGKSAKSRRASSPATAPVATAATGARTSAAPTTATPQPGRVLAATECPSTQESLVKLGRLSLTDACPKCNHPVFDHDVDSTVKAAKVARPIAEHPAAATFVSAVARKDVAGAVAALTVMAGV